MCSVHTSIVQGSGKLPSVVQIGPAAHDRTTGELRMVFKL